MAKAEIKLKSSHHGMPLLYYKLLQKNPLPYCIRLRMLLWVNSNFSLIQVSLLRHSWNCMPKRGLWVVDLSSRDSSEETKPTCSMGGPAFFLLMCTHIHTGIGIYTLEIKSTTVPSLELQLNEKPFKHFMFHTIINDICKCSYTSNIRFIYFSLKTIPTCLLVLCKQWRQITFSKNPKFWI